MSFFSFKFHHYTFTGGTQQDFGLFVFDWSYDIYVGMSCVGIESFSNRSSYKQVRLVCWFIQGYKLILFCQNIAEKNSLKLMHNILSGFFVFAVTTQREAIIFFTAEVSTLLTTMLLHFLVKYNYIFFFFIVILVGLLNDTENLVFYVKHDLLCLHFREYIILLVCFFCR